MKFRQVLEVLLSGLEGDSVRAKYLKKPSAGEKSAGMSARGCLPEDRLFLSAQVSLNNGGESRVEGERLFESLRRIIRGRVYVAPPPTIHSG